MRRTFLFAIIVIKLKSSVPFKVNLDNDFLSHFHLLPARVHTLATIVHVVTPRLEPHARAAAYKMAPSKIKYRAFEQIQNNWHTNQQYRNAGKMASQLGATLKYKFEFGKRTDKLPTSAHKPESWQTSQFNGSALVSARDCIQISFFDLRMGGKTWKT